MSERAAFRGGRAAPLRGRSRGSGQASAPKVRGHRGPWSDGGGWPGTVGTSPTSITAPWPVSSPSPLRPCPHVISSRCPTAQELQGSSSQRRSVLIARCLGEAIVVCTPGILVSVLQSATLMRTESIHEKCLLSRVLTYSSDITVLDSSVFSPTPIPSPRDELSI